MPGAAFDGSKTKDSTATDITYQIWNPWKYPYPCGTPEFPATCYNGGYDNYNGTSIVRGTIQASATSVYINGKAAALMNDRVREEETPQGLPGGAVNIRNADGGFGQVTSGNNVQVYCEGKLLAVIGSTARTHANGSTNIADGSTNVIIG
ncbi:hypothetical protein [Paenibacillus pinihumi]|uniref:hypothetical protein n=1 Tax=Paenibacillus pinihumi TaxID=669462 RepID=UPI00040E6D16|nr:hypothetical protein [Paenibacillus pinihumi]